LIVEHLSDFGCLPDERSCLILAYESEITAQNQKVLCLAYRALSDVQKVAVFLGMTSFGTFSDIGRNR